MGGTGGLARGTSVRRFTPWSAALLAALCTWSTTAPAQVLNNVLFAAANGQTKPCGFVTTPSLSNDDFSVTSGESTLYRVDRVTGDAVEVGPIQDPNIGGKEVSGYLIPGAVLMTQHQVVVLDASERLQDVCGLAAAHGRLFGTAVLETLRFQVLVEINPETAEADVIETTMMDKGLWGSGNIEPAVNGPDPTMCIIQDLTNDAANGRIAGIGSCMYKDPTGNPANRIEADTQRTQVTRIDPGSGESQENANINSGGNDVSVNLDAPGTAFRTFTPVSLVLEPSTGLLSGGVLGVWVHYNFDGTLDKLVQAAAGLVNNPANFTDGRVRAAEAYWPLGRYVGPLQSNATTALAVDSSDPNEALYRSFVGGNILGGTFNGLSSLELIDVVDGSPLVAAVPIVDVATSNQLIGVQAITFVDYPDDRDQLGPGATIPLEELVPCPPNPRNAAACGLGHPSGKPSQLLFRSKQQRLQWVAHRGQRMTRADLGNPRVDTDYALCFYGGAPDGGTQRTLYGGRQLPAGKRWKKTSQGFKYSHSRPPTEVSLWIKDGTGEVKVKASGKWTDFPPPPFDNRGASVQLINDEGGCWSGDYPNGTWLRNSSSRFQAEAQ